MFVKGVDHLGVYLLLAEGLFAQACDCGFQPMNILNLNLPRLEYCPPADVEVLCSRAWEHEETCPSLDLFTIHLNSKIYTILTSNDNLEIVGVIITRVVSLERFKLRLGPIYIQGPLSCPGQVPRAN